MAVYSLSHYQLVISLNNDMKKYMGNYSETGLIIGGSASYIETITVKRNEDTWTVKGDFTGSYVHTLNSNKTGEITLSINQKSTTTKLLNIIAGIYLSKGNNNEILNLNKLSFPQIQLKDLLTNKVIVEAKDAYLKRPADKSYGSEAGNEEWSFVCGSIEFLGNL